MILLKIVFISVDDLLSVSSVDNSEYISPMISFLVATNRRDKERKRFSRPHSLRLTPSLNASPAVFLLFFKKSLGIPNKLD